MHRDESVSLLLFPPRSSMQADELQRQVLEAKARLVDSEHVAKQLHKVMGERDALQEQVNALRNAHSQGETGHSHLAGRPLAAAFPLAADTPRCFRCMCAALPRPGR